MTYLEVTLVFVAFPLVANAVLAAAAISLPAAFDGGTAHCWAAAAIALLAAVWSFCAFLVDELGPRRTLLALLGHGLALIVVFAGVYQGYGLAQGAGAAPLKDDWEGALYFSVVTWTTLGYGDLTPLPELRLLAALQALLGYVFFGLSVGLGTYLLTERSPAAAAIRAARSRRN